MLGMGTGRQAQQRRQNSPPAPPHPPTTTAQPEAPIFLPQRLAEVKPHRLSELLGKVWDPLGMTGSTGNDATHLDGSRGPAQSEPGWRDAGARRRGTRGSGSSTQVAIRDRVQPTHPVWLQVRSTKAR